MTADAYHMTAPDPDGDGAVRAMAGALRDGGLRPEDVGYINAHGTSTPYNDKTETLAIKQVFGEHARRLAVSSTKSMTGHLLGAAGGIEAIVTVLALQQGILPPTINYETPDPECDLDYVPNVARKAEVDVGALERLRLRRHQRHARLPALARLSSPRPAASRRPPFGSRFFEEAPDRVLDGGARHRRSGPKAPSDAWPPWRPRVGLPGRLRPADPGADAPVVRPRAPAGRAQRDPRLPGRRRPRPRRRGPPGPARTGRRAGDADGPAGGDRLDARPGGLGAGARGRTRVSGSVAGRRSTADGTRSRCWRARFEAVVGVLYLAGGLAAVLRLVERLLADGVAPPEADETT